MVADDFPGCQDRAGGARRTLRTPVIAAGEPRLASSIDPSVTSSPPGSASSEAAAYDPCVILDDIVASGIVNMAATWEFVAKKTGGRSMRWHDVWAADSGSRTRVFNRATVVRRVEPSSAEMLAERIVRFFAGGEGGDYILNDPWGSVDLGPFGFEPWWSLPFMVLLPGATPQPPPPGFEVVRVADEGTLAAFEHALVAGFPIPELQEPRTGAVFDGRALGDSSFRMWLGLVDGLPIGTSVAHVRDGVVGVYLVAVIEEARRRGFGEALTWRALLANASVPSTLQASAMGRPLYERMGYQRVLDCATWVRTR